MPALVALLATQCTDLHGEGADKPDGAIGAGAQSGAAAHDARVMDPRASDSGATNGRSGNAGDAGSPVTPGGGCAAGEPQCDAGESATEAGTPPDNTGIATAGEPCAQEQDRACSGHAAVGKLVCSGGAWVGNGSCDGNTRCDSQPGATLGTCQTIASGCVGKNPGDLVCDGTTRERCDVDLLHYEDDPCGANRHCAPADAASCVCDSGYEENAAGTCTNIDDCAGNACGAGASACADGVTTRSCTCLEGYDGTGTEACADRDECAQSNVCNSDYPCSNLEPGYSCRGEFAEWPMPDSSTGSGTKPSYTITTGGATGGTVVDNVTGLMWQRDLPATAELPTVPTYPGCTKTPGSPTPAGTLCTFPEGESYCASLTLGGHSDWRLPTKIELESIVDVTSVQPSIDGNAFPSTPQGLTWTSSPYTGSSSGAMWAVEFVHGFSGTNGVSNGGPVRCVR